MGKRVSVGDLVSWGFTAVLIVLGLTALSVGVGAGLGLVDNEHGTTWRDVTLNLSMGVALVAGIWVIKRSPLVGSGLVVYGAIIIGLGTLWTTVIPIVMAFVAIGACARAMMLVRKGNSLLWS